MSKLPQRVKCIFIAMNHPVRGVEVQSRVDLSQCLCLQLLRRGCQRQTHLMRTSAPFELEHHPQHQRKQLKTEAWRSGRHARTCTCMHKHNVTMETSHVEEIFINQMMKTEVAD